VTDDLDRRLILSLLKINSSTLWIPLDIP
jgi:hypothetical protein